VETNSVTQGCVSPSRNGPGLGPVGRAGSKERQRGIGLRGPLQLAALIGLALPFGVICEPRKKQSRRQWSGGLASSPCAPLTWPRWVVGPITPERSSSTDPKAYNRSHGFFATLKSERPPAVSGRRGPLNDGTFLFGLNESDTAKPSAHENRRPCLCV
jgi:hypothetical protein